MIDVYRYNESFPTYPRLTRDAGWIYGVWYCGTSWNRVKLHGQYPPGFLGRALSLFPDAKDILQCPSGTIEGPGMTVDLICDEIRRPKVQASADRLPFPDDSFDLYLSDPPYTKGDSRKYGCPPFPIRGMMKEAGRVLRPGGCLAMLHLSIPQFRKEDWELRGTIAVITGFRRATRMFSLFRSRKNEDRIPYVCWLCKTEKTGAPKWWGRGVGETETCQKCFRSLTRCGPKGTLEEWKKLAGRWREGLIKEAK